MKKCYIFFKIILYINIGIAIVFILITSLVLCGKYKYKGEHTALYTEAVNSLLWTNGHSWGADFARDSEISIVEEDEYGRTLYSYREKYFFDLTFSALLVSQYCTDNEVYYYEDVNYIVLEQERYTELKEFSEAEISALKDKNDWNKEIDKEKCISQKLINCKKDIDFEDEIHKRIKEDFDANNTRSYILTEKNNKVLFYGCFWNPDSDKYYYGMKNDKNEIVLVYTDDYYTYSDDLQEFKTANSWYLE